ncbi:MAG: Ribonuclease HI [Parcubacteria group bacterium GW2011_GWA2_51_12]|nr:MAG: Ribonuclease HI [Parcubacteria group bacterium GW2011_GWA2_51_12]
MSRKLKIFTDGGARGNPGPAALGAVIYDDSGKVVKKRTGREAAE